jgi:peptide/nickel transport system substrate-binding protein
MKKRFFVFCAVLMAIALLASACAPAATQAPAEATAPPQQNTITEATATTEPSIAPSAAPTEIPSLVGGTVTLGLTFEPDTLDPQKTANGASTFVMNFLYSSLIIKDDQGNYVPYLAASWEVSPDGITYTFHLRQDVKFHNGDPLTASDVAWTYQRALLPETASPATASTLSALDTVQALDDYTVQFTLKSPSYYFLDSLANDNIEGILDQKAVEQAGEDYGRNPVGTGPFIFKEWVTGDHITMERNPDFTWGPSYTEGTPPNIQTLIFRIIPEPSTILAGLEAGEIDFAGIGQVLPQDVTNLEATGNFNIVRNPASGLFPFVIFNLTKAPFDDVRVRQALNYATNRQAIIDVVVPNSGAVIQNGPLSSSQEGYWPGIEQLGYSYDLDKAKQLMQDAGYTYNADGMLEKDGQPLSFDLITIVGFDVFNKPAEIIQSQWKELGVDVKLMQLDPGVAVTNINSGDYISSMMGVTYSNSEMLILLFHSKNIGAMNMSQLNDPELDAILDKMVTTTNREEHLQASQDAQKRIVEQAYVIPLFSQAIPDIISSRIKGYEDSFYNGFRLWNAYIQP